jgi:DNA mismatch repair ATPase MutS
METTKTQLEKYYECKCKHSDVIFLFRVGDFYEVYERDAIDAAKILGIIVTSTELKSGSTFCFAGFPKHALDIYLPKLVRAGRRIAINE